MTEYLIGVGAAKCGTTLLYDLLKSHPSLSKAKDKELHYFDRTCAPDKRSYDGLFDGSGGVKLDVTPIYMFYQDCIGKICDTLGADNVKIVVLLRDPIERARSHYDMLKAQGRETLSFVECFEREDARIAESERNLRLYSYFTRGLYYEQLCNIYRHVPRENVRVYIFEEFVKNQQAAVDDICDFAELARVTVRDKHANRGIVNVRFKWLNDLVRALSRVTPRALKPRFLRGIKHAITKANEKPVGRAALDPDFKRKLVRYYEADVNKLREEFGFDVSAWKNFGEEERVA